MRVVGDPAGRVLVFDRNEWECFLDGVRKGEFDNAVDLTAKASTWDHSLAPPSGAFPGVKPVDMS
jgi:hypothetical protein